MFQLAPKWFMGEAEQVFADRIQSIRLRGYAQDESEIPVPAQFSNLRRYLSVDEIAYGFCPTRRDLYLQRVRRERGKTTWGRIAGTLMEKYCKGIIDGYHNESSASYGEISANIVKYDTEFERTHSGELNSLAKYVREPAESVGQFRSHLSYAARVELSMLETDRYLQEKNGEFEFLRTFPLQYREEDVVIEPNSKVIGINSPSRPDFLIPGFSMVGDLKSGKRFDDYYRLTCAGYALAYESQYGKAGHINFGIIYFLGTRTEDLYGGQTYLFLIDDDLRREFLDKRNQALEIIGRAEAPDLVDRDKHCLQCKFLDVCDTDRGHQED
jgi:CRISPR-associated protein Csa1